MKNIFIITLKISLYVGKGELRKRVLAHNDTADDEIYLAAILLSLCAEIRNSSCQFDDENRDGYVNEGIRILSTEQMGTLPA